MRASRDAALAVGRSVSWAPLRGRTRRDAVERLARFTLALAEDTIIRWRQQACGAGQSEEDCERLHRRHRRAARLAIRNVRPARWASAATSSARRSNVVAIAVLVVPERPASVSSVSSTDWLTLRLSCSLTCPSLSRARTRAELDTFGCCAPWPSTQNTGTVEPPWLDRQPRPVRS